MDSPKQFKPVRLYFEVCTPPLYDAQLCPIILLPGTGALHSTWSRVNTQIAHKTRRKVFSLNLRNHGQSEWSENNTLRDHEADMENFLSENGIKKCIIIGHSLGGKVAMFLALRKPHLVEKIITEEIQLTNPSRQRIEEAMKVLAMAKKIKMLPKGLNESDVRSLLSSLIAEKYPNEHEIAFCTPLKKNCDGSFDFDFNLDVIERTFQDASAYAINFEECQKFDGPVLAIYAEGSPMKVEEDEKIKEFFPNAVLHKFHAGNHVLHVERPDEFIKTVSDFINK